jgi:hypothetical protein
LNTGLLNGLSFGRRRHEAAELALDEFGESDRRAILKVGPDDLDADRQTGCLGVLSFA